MSDVYKVQFFYSNMSVSCKPKSKSRVEALFKAIKYLEDDLQEQEKLEEPIEYIKIGTVDDKGEWTNDTIFI